MFKKKVTAKKHFFPYKSQKVVCQNRRANHNQKDTPTCFSTLWSNHPNRVGFNHGWFIWCHQDLRRRKHVQIIILCSVLQNFPVFPRVFQFFWSILCFSETIFKFSFKFAKNVYTGFPSSQVFLDFHLFSPNCIQDFLVFFKFVSNFESFPCLPTVHTRLVLGFYLSILYTD